MQNKLFTLQINKGEIMKIVSLNIILFSFIYFFSVTAYNAGVLPYSKHKGKIYFLLGQEAFGTLKNKWADFGGGGKRGETIQQTALRELREESRGTYQLTEKDLNPKSGITNPDKSYSLFLAEVDYKKPQEILNGPDQTDKEKKDFIWVNAKHFIGIMKISGRHSAIYKSRTTDMELRHHFVPYFTDNTTRNAIEKIIGLPPSSIQPKEEPAEGGWITVEETKSKEEETPTMWGAITKPEEEEEWVSSLGPRELEISLKRLKEKLDDINNFLR